jgi:hypothetical protein
MSPTGRSYLWNMIHCDTVTMLSCVSFKVDSFALSASSENDMVAAFDRDLRPQFAIAQPVFVSASCTRMETDVWWHATGATLLANCKLPENYATKVETGIDPSAKDTNVR